MKIDDKMVNNDWIRISIKYGGNCLHCKKKIVSGEYGYWSRTFKSVLHEKCYQSLFNVSPTSSPLSSSIHSTSSHGTGNANVSSATSLSVEKTESTRLTSTRYANNIEKKIKCFICNNYIDFNKEIIISLLNIGNKYLDEIDFFYCSNCLESTDYTLFENYVNSFINLSKK